MTDSPLSLSLSLSLLTSSWLDGKGSEEDIRCTTWSFSLALRSVSGLFTLFTSGGDVLSSLRLPWWVGRRSVVLCTVLAVSLNLTCCSCGEEEVVVGSSSLAMTTTCCCCWWWWWGPLYGGWIKSVLLRLGNVLKSWLKERETFKLVFSNNFTLHHYCTCIVNLLHLALSELQLHASNVIL